MDVLQIEKRIRGRVKAQMEKSQREYYLNEQMKAIQKELGDMEDGTNEIGELEQKVAKAGMPKEARDKATAEINKLKMMSPMSAEATVVRNYVDWLVKVPWKKRTRLHQGHRQRREGPGRGPLRAGEGQGAHRRVPGGAAAGREDQGPDPVPGRPAGVGKTSLGQSMARATNRKFVRMSLGGVRDEAEIRGHRRTYIGSMPGKIVQNMAKAGVHNPLFLLDEVDKMAMDFRGDPSSALLEVLDPEQNYGLQRSLPRGRFRPVRGDVRVHGEFAQHSPAAARPHGGHPSARLHRGREAQYRAALPGAEADQAERPQARRAQGVRSGAARHRALLHARGGVRNLEREIAKISRKAVKQMLLDRDQRSQGGSVTPRNLDKSSASAASATARRRT